MRKFLIGALITTSTLFTCQLQANDGPTKDKNESADVEGVPREKMLHKNAGCQQAQNESEQEQSKASVVDNMEDWIKFSTRPNGDMFFYDNTRVEKKDNQISVWVRVRYKTSIMAASSYQNLLRLDCSENSETILQDTFYTDKDWTKPAMATNTNVKPKKQVQENSATAQLMSILCKD